MAARALAPSQLLLALVLTQAAHSLEEYRYRLFDVFPPARVISDAISLDRAIGFALANGILVLLGFACWLFARRTNGPAVRALMWFWAVLEMVNGTGHLLLAIAAGGYFPGTATAPLLLLLGGLLAFVLSKSAAG